MLYVWYSFGSSSPHNHLKTTTYKSKFIKYESNKFWFMELWNHFSHTIFDHFSVYSFSYLYCPFFLGLNGRDFDWESRLVVKNMCIDKWWSLRNPFFSFSLLFVLNFMDVIFVCDFFKYPFRTELIRRGSKGFSVYLQWAMFSVYHHDWVTRPSANESNQMQRWIQKLMQLNEN